MKSEIKKSLKWAFSIAVITLVLAAIFSIISTAVLHGVGVISGILVVLVIIFIHLFFDIIGVASTAASEVPFHAMASKKVRGAKYAVWLTKNADRVSSFCNDVIGDICGIVSGTAAAVVMVELVALFSSKSGGLIEYAMSVIVTSLVAALTVYVKALGKTYAIRYSTDIIYKVGFLIYFTEQRLHIPILSLLDQRKNNKARKRKEK
ncbi:hypothetical protein EWI07_09990 [Sporolactobacillus sp. THM7-4]|nr:hypothetical protein EWI07_09990 [Sporolactobacillus sp. THM7-4]